MFILESFKQIIGRLSYTAHSEELKRLILMESLDVPSAKSSTGRVVLLFLSCSCCHLSRTLGACC